MNIKETGSLGNDIDPETGNFMNKEINKDHSDRILRLLGLNPTDFQGKGVLDVGSGEEHLRKRLADEGVACNVVSLDFNPAVFEKGPDRQTAVVADIYSADLPFKPESFDLVVNVGGPTKDTDVCKKMLAVTKTGGEVRIFYPDFFWPQVNNQLYELVSKGQIPIPKNQVDNLAGSEPVTRDRNGWIIPNPGEGTYVWMQVYDSLSKDNKANINQMVANKLQAELGKVEISLLDSDPAADDYSPTLIIKKL